MADQPSGTLLRIRVHPGASRDQIIGWLDDGTLKVRIAAPPVEGKANSRLIRFLAELLGVPKTSVRIVRGAAAARKVVLIENLAAAEVRKRVETKG